MPGKDGVKDEGERYFNDWSTPAAPNSLSSDLEKSTETPIPPATAEHAASASDEIHGALGQGTPGERGIELGTGRAPSLTDLPDGSGAGPDDSGMGTRDQ